MVVSRPLEAELLTGPVTSLPGLPLPLLPHFLKGSSAGSLE